MKSTPSTSAAHSLPVASVRAPFSLMKNHRPTLQPTALALALGALCLSVAAQAQQQTQAALPKAQDETFSSKNIAQQTRGVSEAPLAYTSFAAMAESRVRELRLHVSTTALPADGRTVLVADLTIVDDAGQPLPATAEVTLEASGGARILLADETANDVDINKMDGNRVQPGKQAKAEGGKLRFQVLAPMQPGDITVRASVAGRSVMAQISALPEQSELFAVGMVEVSLRGYKDSPIAIDRAKDGDAFEQEINNWRIEFGNGIYV